MPLHEGPFNGLPSRVMRGPRRSHLKLRLLELLLHLHGMREGVRVMQEGLRAMPRAAAVRPRTVLPTAPPPFPPVWAR